MEALGDFIAGSAAGMVAKVVEFPLDTVKVRMQDRNCKYSGYMNCFARMYQEEGFLSFYKGLPAPMAGAMLENAVGFAFYGRGQALYRSVTGNTDVVLPLQACALAGANAGIAMGVILTPVELLKCRMQLQNLLPVEKRLYRNVLDCAIKVVQQEGPLALFKGLSATLAREVPGNAAWFGFYETTTRMMCKPGETKENLPVHKLAMCGGGCRDDVLVSVFPSRCCEDAHADGAVLPIVGPCARPQGGVQDRRDAWPVQGVEHHDVPCVPSERSHLHDVRARDFSVPEAIRAPEEVVVR